MQAYETRPPDPNREYKIRVLAYIATVLSENVSVKDYAITFQTNITRVPDDFMVKVDYHHLETPHLYFVQVTRRLRKVDFTERYSLDEYVADFRAVANNQNERIVESFGRDVQMYLWYFSNRRVTMDGYDFVQHEESYRAIFTKTVSENCFKLAPIAVDNPNEHQDFLNNSFLFLNQGNYINMLSDLQETLNISSASVISLINYVDDYFKDTIGVQNRLTKSNFDTETLRLRLSDSILPPYTKIFQMNTELAQIWNNLTLDYDITLVDDVKDIKRCIFGCVHEKIRKDLDLPDFAWNDDSLDEDFKTQFKRLLTKKNSVGTTRIKHYWIVPDNLKVLLEELWRLDLLPLVLKGDCCVSILKRYRYLRKKFIIIANLSEDYEKTIPVDGRRVFRNVSDLENGEFDRLTTLTDGILISLQGREPRSLRNLIDYDHNVMQQINSSYLLQLIRKRKVYVNKNCFENVGLTIFVVEDVSSKDTWNILDADDGKEASIKITCKNLERFAEETQTWLRLDNYSLCYLRVMDGKLEFVQGDVFKLKHFFVDQDSHDVFLDENNDAVPMIGQRLGVNECVARRCHIKRSLRRSILNSSFFDREERCVCFLCGDIESLNSSIRQQIAADDILDKIKANPATTSNVFIAIKNSPIENYWSDPYFHNYQKLYVKIVAGSMEILKHERCNDLKEHVSHGKAVGEDDLFKEVNSKVTIISGEAGIGKSTLLHSLCQRWCSEEYVLFCDLHHFIKHLQGSFSRFLPDPFQFIFEETEQNVFQNLSQSIFNFHKKNGRLVLFLDSLDEALRVCQDEALEFLVRLKKAEVKIVISCRLINETLLEDLFGAQPIRIDAVERDDVKDYFNRSFIETTTQRNLDYIPEELLRNPLHLALLSLAESDKFSIYQHVIESQIKWYCHRYQLPYSKTSKYSRNFILGECKLLALVAVFGKEAIINLGIITNYKDLVEIFKLQGMALGIINNFENDTAVFQRDEFAHYLAMEWLKENIEEKNSAKMLYKMMMKDDDAKIKYFFDNLVCAGLTLHAAVLNGNVDQVNILCKKEETNLMELDKVGRTPLHTAASNLSNDNRNSYCILETVIKCMLTRGCSFDISDEYMKWTWVQYLNVKELHVFVKNCCYYGLTNTLELYLNSEGENINIEDSLLSGMLANSQLNSMLVLLKRNSSLLDKYIFGSIERALEIPRVDIVSTLIELKCPQEAGKEERRKILCEISDILNGNNNIGVTPLHIAAVCGNVEVMRELLLEGVDVNAGDKFKRSPLHYSAASGSKEIVRLLVKGSSDLLAKDENGDTALHLALRLSKIDVVDLLLTGAREYTKNKNVGSLLHIAVGNNLCDITEALLRNGINVNLTDERGNSPLHIAALNGYSDIVKLLLDGGANVEQRNLQNNTPLHLACDGSHLQIIEAILEGIALTKASELLSLKNNNGETPLHVACRKGELYGIMPLLERGGDVWEADDSGRTSMHILVEWNWLESFEEIMAKIPLTEDAFVDLKQSLTRCAIERGRVSFLKLLLKSNR